jgi:hypothetical protein
MGACPNDTKARFTA